MDNFFSTVPHRFQLTSKSPSLQMGIERFTSKMMSTIIVKNHGAMPKASRLDCHTFKGLQ